MIFGDHPPPLWAPPKPAIIRQADQFSPLVGMIPGLVFPRAFGGVVDLSFIGAHVDATDASTYTFSGRSIGAAAPDRVVLVAVSSIVGGSNFTFTLTVGGSAATLIVEAGSTSVRGRVAIFAIAVPAGTTADVVVTMSITTLKCGIAIYRMVGAGIGLTPHATGSDEDTSDPQTASINVPANGAALAVAANSVASCTHDWTGGLTENHDTLIETPTTFSSAHANFTSAQTPLAITVDYVGAAPDFHSLAAASWGPV